MELRNHASSRFYSICDHFDTGIPQGDFSRARLIHYTYTHLLSEESGDNFLRAFFRAVDLQIDGDEPISFEDIHLRFLDFGDYLFDNFFLPAKASAKETPQPSPDLHSDAQEAQGQGRQQDVGADPRLFSLWSSCLVRDRHRCVISRKFDRTEAIKRHDVHDSPQDDGGNLLRDNPYGMGLLEVAHILPCSLTKGNKRGELVSSTESAIAILNMLDVGVANMIEGPEIDTSFNAITLTHDLHELFGDFKIFFEPVDNKPHTYKIDTYLPKFLVSDFAFPITRKLDLTADQTIGPPSPQLLAIHCAIAKILHLSGAGNYIDKIYRDMEKRGIEEDGSTPLGRFLSLRLR